MSLEHNPARQDGASASSDPRDLDYWNSLINERAAGDFLGLTERTMQSYRQTGGGPRYVQISSRCLRYRRIDLKAWAEQRLRTSTSEEGAAA